MNFNDKKNIYNIIITTIVSAIICTTVVFIGHIVFRYLLDKVENITTLQTITYISNVIISTTICYLIQKLAIIKIIDRIILKEIKKSNYLFYHHKEEKGYHITRVHLIEATSLNDIKCEDVEKKIYTLSEKDLRSLFN